MIVTPFCKINLGLNVVGVRPDGYHDIESVFLPVGLSDVLEIALPDGDGEGVALSCSGNKIDVPPEKNICVKALNALRQVAPVPFVAMHLHKVIPDGAGLGGGSSDAAFVIKTLNDMLGLGLPSHILRGVAAKVGADCPFFIDGRPAFVSGIGDVFSEVDTSALRGVNIVIVVPQGAVSTAEAYANMDIGRPAVGLKDAVRHDVKEWKDLISNDFEPNAIEMIPDIALIKQRLYDHGAVYAQMSGSGSSVFGLFLSDSGMPTEYDFPNARCFWRGKLDF